MSISRETLAHDWSQRQRHLHKEVKPAVRQRAAVLLETPMNLLIRETANRIIEECGIPVRDATRSARALVREVLNGILEGQALGEFQGNRHRTLSDNRNHRGLAVVG
ncbi:MAG: hypothetical protein AAB864_02195 [Patescibacteria group bacterium]